MIDSGPWLHAGHGALGRIPVDSTAEAVSRETAARGELKVRTRRGAFTCNQKRGKHGLRAGTTAICPPLCAGSAEAVVFLAE